MQRLLHLHVHTRHPDLDRAIVGLDEVFKVEGLGLVRLHTYYLLALGHDELFAVIEEF